MSHDSAMLGHATLIVLSWGLTMCFTFAPLDFMSIFNDISVIVHHKELVLPLELSKWKTKSTSAEPTSKLSPLVLFETIHGLYYRRIGYKYTKVILKGSACGYSVAWHLSRLLFAASD